MVGKFNVVTLCGSTKFKDEFIEVQKKLTLEGNIVISVGLFGHSGDTEAMTEETKEMLDEMHKRKIDMADHIFVINKDGYIGSSTKNEIAYAFFTKKPIGMYDRNNAQMVMSVVDDCIQTALSSKLSLDKSFDEIIYEKYGFHLPALDEKTMESLELYGRSLEIFPRRNYHV